MLAGASGLPWRTFAAYNAAGVVAWSIVIGLVGDLLGASWGTLERWIGRSSGIALALILVFIVIVAVRARRQRTS
jgi:membrane-associated protein